MFVSVTTCRRTVNRVVELRLADASIRFLFLELVRALSVLLVLVLVGYKVCQWCEPILSVITAVITEPEPAIIHFKTRASPASRASHCYPAFVHSAGTFNTNPDWYSRHH